jgi:hypothetical protein
MSDKQETKMLKNVRRLVVFSALALILSIVGMINAFGGRQYPIDRAAEAGTTCYIDIQLLYGPFEQGGDDGYYLALDAKLEFYIVRLGKSDIEKCRDIIAYVQSGGSGTVPETVRVVGVMRDVDDTVSAGAVQEFNKLLGSPVADESNLSRYLGTTYLDAARHLDMAWYVNFIPSAVCIAFAGMFLGRHYKYTKADDLDKNEIAADYKTKESGAAGEPSENAIEAE